MRRRKNELDIRHRRNIYHFILKHQGHHYREICKALKISKNNITYHLNYLIKHGLITESIENGYSRYYIVQLEYKRAEAVAKILGDSITYKCKNRVLAFFKAFNPGKRDKEVINLLRRPPILKIVKFLFVNYDSTQIEISKFIDKHQTTVSLYLKELFEKNIVERISDGKSIKYRLKDEDYIYEILRMYFSYKEVLNENGDPTGKSDDFMADAMYSCAFDLFTFPFCAGYKPWIKRDKK